MLARFTILAILLRIYITQAWGNRNVFKLDNANPNDPNLKSLVIKGIAKFKPGGSAMILSLLIQGAPGMMPGGTPACCSKRPSGNPTQQTQAPSQSVAPSSPPPPPASSAGPIGNTGAPTIVPPISIGQPSPVPQRTMRPSTPPRTMGPSPIPRRSTRPSTPPRTMGPSPISRRTTRPSVSPRTMQPSPIPRRTMRPSPIPRRTMRPSPIPRRTMRPSPIPRRTMRPSAAPRTLRPSPIPRTSMRPSPFPRKSRRPIPPTGRALRTSPFPRRSTRPIPVSGRSTRPSPIPRKSMRPALRTPFPRRATRPMPQRQTPFQRRHTRPPLRSSTGPTEGPPPTEPNNGPPTGSTGGPPMGANAQPPTTPNGISTGTAKPSVPPSPGVVQQAPKDFEQEALDVHNGFRQKHNAPKMRLNKRMSQMAQAYARKIAALGILQHSPAAERQGQGENLSMGCKTGPNGGQTVTEAVTNWYNEVCSPGYEFGTERMGGAGHFTQVVWRGSTELGIGKAEGMKGNLKCTYIVGRYNPAGNFLGRFKNNVQTGTFNRDAYCAKNRLRDYQPQPLPKIMAISETVKRNLMQRKVKRNLSEEVPTR